MNVASLAIFLILAALSYLHIVDRRGPVLNYREECNSNSEASSCSKNGNCGWCLASGPTNPGGRCIDIWTENVSVCGDCATALNETTCKGAMNPTPFGPSFATCIWAAGRFGKSGCYGTAKQECDLRSLATCSSYPLRNCGVCGSDCVPSWKSSSNSTKSCPACSAYSNGSMCHQGLVPGAPRTAFCFRGDTGQCTSCWSAKTASACASVKQSDGTRPCGWCEGHGCIALSEYRTIRCPKCTALPNINETTCAASVNPDYGQWIPQRCVWEDGQCLKDGCSDTLSPVTCFRQKYDEGTKRCGWCGHHCGRSQSAAKCPSCSTYANVYLCSYSLNPSPGGNNDYCLWDSASERCFGNGSALCKSFATPTSCSQEGHSGDTQCQWCNDALGCTSTDVSKNCTPCSVLSNTNRSTCESYWNGDGNHCIWYNGGCFSDDTDLCASLTTMAQCYPGPRSGQLCGWCGGKCVKQYSSATASCPNCSSLVSATDCYHSVIPNGQPGGAGLCIWSNSLSRCFGGDTAYCAAFSNNATACAAAGVFPCGICGKHGCVQPPSFNQPACPKCDTITTADLCKASYNPNSQGRNMLCAWKEGKCINPNAAP